MARSTRKASLETRTARESLPAKKRHWVNIGKGLALGYRKGASGGSWYVRLAKESNRYTLKAIGQADDYREAPKEYNDACTIQVFNYFQAQDRAKEIAVEIAIPSGGGPYTVRAALEDYMASRERPRSLPAEWASINAHILPVLGERPVNALTTKEIRDWRDALAKAPARIRGPGNLKKIPEDDSELSEYRRKRKATANRVFTSLKAALNRAWTERTDIPSDTAWRKVKPFGKVDVPKIRYLTQAECLRLLNGCPPDFRQLVRGGLLTGARYGELTRTQVRDYSPDMHTLLLREPKEGESRHVPLNDAGQQFFDQLTVGRHGKEVIFLHDDGRPWGKSHQTHRLVDACKAAEIAPAIGFHILRHTYATLLLEDGVSIRFVSEAIGASVQVVEKHYGHVIASALKAAINKSLPSFGVEKSNVVRVV